MPAGAFGDGVELLYVGHDAVCPLPAGRRPTLTDQDVLVAPAAQVHQRGAIRAGNGKQHDEVQTVDVPIDGLVEVADRERDKGWHPIDVAGDLLRGDVHVCDRRASRNGRLKSCWSAK